MGLLMKMMEPQLTWIEGQAFSHYRNWECYAAGFWESCNSAVHNAGSVSRSALLLASPAKFALACERITDEWPVTSGVHFSNQANNAKSFLGQAACFLNHNAMRCCTASAWWTLSDQERSEANSIAQEVIDKWLLDNVVCRKQSDQLELMF